MKYLDSNAYTIQATLRSSLLPLLQSNVTTMITIELAGTQPISARITARITCKQIWTFDQASGK